MKATSFIKRFTLPVCARNRLHGRIALLRCVGGAEFQHWVGVGELMVEEAREEAENLLREQKRTRA